MSSLDCFYPIGAWAGEACLAELTAVSSVFELLLAGA